VLGLPTLLPPPQPLVQLVESARSGLVPATFAPCGHIAPPPRALGLLAPSTPFAWTDVWVNSVPATLGWLPMIVVQPVHLDGTGLRFGSFATFTVL